MNPLYQHGEDTIPEVKTNVEPFEDYVSMFLVKLKKYRHQHFIKVKGVMTGKPFITRNYVSARLKVKFPNKDIKKIENLYKKCCKAKDFEKEFDK